jgi:hypothetical protein
LITSRFTGRRGYDFRQGQSGRGEERWSKLIEKPNRWQCSQG